MIIVKMIFKAFKQVMDGYKRTPARVGNSYGTSMVRVTSVWRWSHSERTKASLTSARG